MWLPAHKVSIGSSALFYKEVIMACLGDAKFRAGNFSGFALNHRADSVFPWESVELGSCAQRLRDGP